MHTPAPPSRRPVQTLGSRFTCWQLVTPWWLLSGGLSSCLASAFSVGAEEGMPVLPAQFLFCVPLHSPCNDGRQVDSMPTAQRQPGALHLSSPTAGKQLGDTAQDTGPAPPKAWSPDSALAASASPLSGWKRPLSPRRYLRKQAQRLVTWAGSSPAGLPGSPQPRPASRAVGPRTSVLLGVKALPSGPSGSGAPSLIQPRSFGVRCQEPRVCLARW